MEAFLKSDSELIGILEAKYEGRNIEELWRNFLDVNEEINGYAENNLLTNFYESIIETLFISEKIKKRPFSERQYLSASIKFWQEYWNLMGNFIEEAKLKEQFIYLQKLAY